jgi:hypothetical protein
MKYIKRVKDRKGYRVCVIWKKCDKNSWKVGMEGSFGFTWPNAPPPIEFTQIQKGFGVHNFTRKWYCGSYLIQQQQRPETKAANKACRIISLPTKLKKKLLSHAHLSLFHLYSHNAPSHNEVDKSNPTIKVTLFFYFLLNKVTLLGDALVSANSRSASSVKINLVI